MWKKCCLGWPWSASSLPSPSSTSPLLLERLPSASDSWWGDSMERPQRPSRAQCLICARVGILVIKPYSFVSRKVAVQGHKESWLPVSVYTPPVSYRQKGDFDNRLDRLISIFLEAQRTVPQGEAGFVVIYQLLRTAQGPEPFRKDLARITEEDGADRHRGPSHQVAFSVQTGVLICFRISQ